VPQYQKGVAAQLPFVMRDSTGALMTGRTVLAHISKDGSPMGAVSSGTAPAVELEGGGYYFNHSAADMNANSVAVRYFALGTPACADTFEFISPEADLTTAVVANLTTKVNQIPANPAAVGSAMTLAAGSITAAVIATDAVDADALAADAIVEIAAGILTTVLTQAYATLGAAPTLSQLLFEVRSLLAEKVISGTSLIAKKLDGSTVAGIYTINDATNPTSITRTL